MKKIIAIIALLEILTVLISAAIAFRAGQHDIIMSQEPWILETDVPENGDFILHIRIHDEWHEYTGYIG